MTTKAPPISEAQKANYLTLVRAAKSGELAALSVTTRDGEPRVALCAVNREDADYEMVPLAVLVWDNPYELFDPPA